MPQNNESKIEDIAERTAQYWEENRKNEAERLHEINLKLQKFEIEIQDLRDNNNNKNKDLHLTRNIRIITTIIIWFLLLTLWVIVIKKLWSSTDDFNNFLNGNGFWFFESILIFTSVVFIVSNNLLHANFKIFKWLETKNKPPEKTE